MDDWLIVVADSLKKPFPPSKDLVRAGVPLSVATRYARLRRREFTPKALVRKARENKN